MASNIRSTGTGKYGAATKRATSSAVGTPYSGRPGPEHLDAHAVGQRRGVGQPVGVVVVEVREQDRHPPHAVEQRCDR